MGGVAVFLVVRSHMTFLRFLVEMYCDMSNVTLPILFESNSPTRFTKSRHVRPA
jgi:hypothetical protein